MLEKKNLVTIIGRGGRMYDILKCSECGHELKIHSLYRPSNCPKCGKGDTNKIPVWGGWTTQNPQDKKCKFCNIPCIEVPKENHQNSYYWRLQRNSEEKLYCCPNGCKEDGSYIYKPVIRKLNRRK